MRTLELRILGGIWAIGAAALLLAGPSLSYAGIVGSAHDFSEKSWNNGGSAQNQQQICIVCHTPHNADVTNVTDAPLWNHLVTSQDFTMYDSSTFDASTSITADPSAQSKLCLSCHDGQTAIDAFGGATTGTKFMGGSESLGIDLADDHPISFTYDTTLSNTDGGLHDPATALSGLAGGGTITADLLFSNRMECASCHDVHDAAGLSKLLRKDNAVSALCLTCHNK